MKTKNLSFDKLINLVTLISNSIFLLVHLTYIIIFLISKTYLMVYINLFSSIFYIFLYLLLYKNKYEIFALLAGIEIISYMSVSSIICGISAGFHLCLIGITVLAFVTKYFLKNKKVVINPLIISCILVCLYIFIFFYLRYNEPVVNLPITTNNFLHIFHAIIVFIFCAGFMYILTTYVLKLEEHIIKISETDNLTRIANRNGLNNYFDILQNNTNNYIAAIFDIDDFKSINDKYGHICGDYILKTIADIAKNNSLDDFVSRWGGEEFVVISKIEENIENTIKKLDNIRIEIENYNFKYKNKNIHSTITIGIASYEENDTLDSWISRADKNLYFGKNNGKNQTIYK